MSNLLNLLNKLDIVLIEMIKNKGEDFKMDLVVHGNLKNVPLCINYSFKKILKGLWIVTNADPECLEFLCNYDEVTEIAISYGMCSGSGS